MCLELTNGLYSMHIDCVLGTGAGDPAPTHFEDPQTRNNYEFSGL